MPFVHENVKVELFPGTPSPIVHLSENDVGDTLAFELIYKGQPVNVPNGSVVKFKGTKKNGLGFTVDSNDISDNVVEFIVSEDMTSCSGVVEAEISITLSNNKHGTCNVVLIVEKNPHSDGTQDGSYPQIVSEMRELVEQIEGDAETASNAADTAVAAKNSALEIQQDVHQYTASAIDDWLDNHPEATTTVNYTITEKVFDTVSDMIADKTLINGAKVKTLGYYSKNDGGGANYIIRPTEAGDIYSETADGSTSKRGLIRLQKSGDVFVAELTRNKTVTLDMFGITSVTDMSLYISDYIYYCNAIKQPMSCRQGGRYNTSAPIDLSGIDISINGNESVITATNAMTSVLIYSYGSTADHSREISNLSIECNGYAKKGISILLAAGLAVNNILVLNPIDCGVDISGGYEVSVLNLTVHNRLYTTTDYEGIGLYVGTSDCFIKNVITINMHIGMKVSAGGNQISNFHPWISGTHPNIFINSYGLYNEAAANTFSQCYFDTCNISVYSSRQVTLNMCTFLIARTMYQYLDHNPVFLKAGNTGNVTDADIEAINCYFENTENRQYNPYVRSGEADISGSSIIIINALKNGNIYTADTFDTLQNHTITRYGLSVSNLTVSPQSVEAKDYSITCDYRDLAIFQSQNGLPNGIIMNAYLVNNVAKLRFYNSTNASITINDRILCAIIRGKTNNEYIHYTNINPM